MSNGLTGEYDVVVEVGVGTINRLLATVHQNSTSADVSPSFPHSLTARVGSMPKRVKFELAEVVLGEYYGAGNFDSSKMTDNVLSNVQQDAAAAQAALIKLERNLSGVIKSQGDGGSMAETVLNVGSAISIVRGTTKIQVGTPTLTLSAGSTTEVTIHAHVRALYKPDAGTAALPAPIHGEVRATFTAAYNPSGSTGKPAIEVKPSDDNNKITFIPAAGTLTSTKATQIAHQIRQFLRTKFGPMSAELPSGFPFSQFKSLVAGGNQAIALPLKSDSDVFALDSVNNLFLAPGDDFALAVSRDVIGDKLAPALNKIKQFDYTYHLYGPFDAIAIGFHAWVSNASLGWQPGFIVLTITGNAHVWGWVVPDADYDFTITQKLKLHLDVPSQTVSLTHDGEPSINGLPQTYKDKARPKIIDARKEALDTVNQNNFIQNELMNTRARFNDALKRFDAAANVKYTALEVGPDGVILRGSLALSGRPPVVVDFRETEGGKALTAFKSWIPAGTVENYVWSWVRRDPNSKVPWEGATVEVRNRPHSFIFQAPIQSGPGKQPRVDLQQVCLTVEGTQIGTGAVSGPDETTCTISTPDWLWGTMPSWWVDLLLPHWGPDPGPEGILEDQIIAHFRVQSPAAPSADAGTAAIIHFASDSSEAPLSILGEALFASRLRDAEVPVIVVLPQGSFEQTRALVKARLGAFPRELSTPLAVTEDYEGSWTKAFKAPAGPATYVMNGTGDLPWEHAGALQAQALTAALDQHGSPGRRGPSRLMRLRVRPGEPAPDLFIEDEVIRQSLAERMLPPRLCGRRTRLLFWKSWSRPCLTELHRLQRVHNDISGEGPQIIAIGDGEQPERVRSIAQEHGLSFTLLPDPASQLAKRYRVACWPTTVWIDEQAVIQRIHFGVTHLSTAHSTRDAAVARRRGD